MDRNTRLDVFQELIDCAFHLPLWRCDEDFMPLDNQPDSWILSKLFLARKQAETVRDYAMEHNKPLILTGMSAMVWIVMPERAEKQITGYSVLGPMLISEPNFPQLSADVHSLTQPWDREKEIMGFIQRISVLPLGRVMEAALMLHYCVTGERITISDLHYRETELPMPQENNEGELSTHGTWAAEQEMLRMVREGDLAYQSQMAKVASAGTIGQLAREGDSMRQIKNAVEVCITLFSRAAIEGGLSPETGLTLCDRYFQAVEACQNVPELTSLSHTMQEDFVQRVHKLRTQGQYSKSIHACMEYIDLHLEEPIPLKELSRMFNYSDYYFTHKFKEETGLTPKDYIRKKRLERAKFLLRTTSESVQEIGGRLQYCSSSYFSGQFRKAYGMTPNAWREGKETQTIL